MFKKITASLNGLVDRVNIIPVVIYLIIAGILTVVAFYALYNAATLTLQMIRTGNFMVGTQEVFVAIFFTITSIVLIETTIVFFRTKHLAVQTLLIAGLTETIRHLIIFDVGKMEPLHLFSLVAILGVLIGGIYLFRPRDGRIKESDNPSMIAME